LLHAWKSHPKYLNNTHASIFQTNFRKQEEIQIKIPKKKKTKQNKKNMEVGSLAPKQLSTIRLLPQGSPSFSPNIKNLKKIQEF
jgi:hypothetical protein